MNIADLRTKTVAELRSELNQLQRKAMNFRFLKASREEVQNTAIKQTRKDIARVKTVLREIELGGKNGNK